MHVTPRVLLTGGCLLALIAGCAGSSHPSSDTSPLLAGPLLAGRSVDTWCSILEPTPADSAWRAIPWHATLHSGIAAASAEGKPLLLWLMNGHPLGCT